MSKQQQPGTGPATTRRAVRRFCPVQTTAAILKRHNIEHDSALEYLIQALSSEAHKFASARRDGALGPRSAAQRQPAVEDLLEEIREQMHDASMDLEFDDKQRPIEVEPGDAEEFKSLAALDEILTALAEDVQREFAGPAGPPTSGPPTSGPAAFGPAASGPATFGPAASVHRTSVSGA